jgi:hypothetical protein
MDDIYRFDVAVSKYRNHIAPSPTIFEREVFKVKKKKKKKKRYMCSKMDICKCQSHKKSVL